MHVLPLVPTSVLLAQQQGPEQPAAHGRAFPFPDACMLALSGDNTGDVQ